MRVKRTNSGLAPDPLAARRDRHSRGQLPGDEPGPDAQFSVPPEQITTELLELCTEFLRQASPIVHTELREFLTENGYHNGGLGWFIDALSFTTRNPRQPSAVES
jgi:hypothetical protein